MSIKLMSIAWDMDIPSTEKLVLLCLCDYASDIGQSCYPAIATLAKRTSKNARTVQRAIRWLEERGLCVSQERIGTSNNYIIDLSGDLSARKNPEKKGGCQNDGAAWCQGGGDKGDRGGVTKTTGGGRRGVTQSINEPSIEPPINNIRVKALAGKPDEVSNEIWNDWIIHRKKKFTETALAGFVREAKKAGCSLDDAFKEALERNWQGFKADWLKGRGNGCERGDGSNSSGASGNANRGGYRATTSGFAQALRQVADADSHSKNKSFY